MPKPLPISAIVPTINRSRSLHKMLRSLAEQSAQPAEVIIVDASTNGETKKLCENPIAGLTTQIIFKRAQRVGAATQRNQAIQHVSQPAIWFVDDDVVFEPDCLLKLWDALQTDPRLGGVNAMITNQRYLPPGLASRLLFRFLHGRSEQSYAGKCIGPALNLLPEDQPNLPEVVPVEWLNTTCTLYRREALPVPLFPEHFKGYSMMEDVALSLKVGKEWKLANVRTARVFHESQMGGHKADLFELSEMELVNRHYVMTSILGRRKATDYLKFTTLQLFTLSSILLSPKDWKSFSLVLKGKLSGIFEIAKDLKLLKNDPPETMYPLW